MEEAKNIFVSFHEFITIVSDHHTHAHLKKMFTWTLEKSSSSSSAEGCSKARALAISPTLGVIICSEAHTSTLVGFPLADVVADTTLTAAFTITSPEPCTALCGWMTFTDDDYLLVTNSTQGAVFIFDVTLRKFIGLMCGPSIGDPALPRPHDVASRGMVTAVSERMSGRQQGAVALYQRYEKLQWVLLRRIFYTMDFPWTPGGLAFSRDASTLATANVTKVDLIHVGSGIFGPEVMCRDSHMFSIVDVEECDDGWAVLVSGPFFISLVFVSSSTGFLRAQVEHHGKAAAGALVHVRTHHIIVNSNGTNKLFACLTPAGAAMAAMSAVRVAWISAVVRSTQ